MSSLREHNPSVVLIFDSDATSPYTGEAFQTLRVSSRAIDNRPPGERRALA